MARAMMITSHPGVRIAGSHMIATVTTAERPETDRDTGLIAESRTSPQPRNAAGGKSVADDLLPRSDHVPAGY